MDGMSTIYDCIRPPIILLLPLRAAKPFPAAACVPTTLACNGDVCTCRTPRNTSLLQGGPRSLSKSVDHLNLKALGIRQPAPATSAGSSKAGGARSTVRMVTGGGGGEGLCGRLLPAA